MFKATQLVTSLLLILLTHSAWSEGISEAQAHRMFTEIKAQAADADHVRFKIEQSKEYPGMIAFSLSGSDNECIVQIHPIVLAEGNPQELAALVGHEMAHCALKHHRQLSEANDSILQALAWRFEYEADDLGLKLALSAGFDARELYEAFLLRVPSDFAHPTGAARVAALRGGVREYPSNEVILAVTSPVAP